MNQLLLFLQKLDESLKGVNDRKVLTPCNDEGHVENRPRINKVCQYINSNYAEPLFLSTVADSIYLSPEAFCRYFKKHTGFTFVEYLSRVRIAKACQILDVDREKAFFEVAYSCGFGSVSSFNRAFKKIMKMTPTDYLRNLDR